MLPFTVKSYQFVHGRQLSILHPQKIVTHFIQRLYHKSFPGAHAKSKNTTNYKRKIKGREKRKNFISNLISKIF